MSKKVLIVGGVAGGASAAARLRRLDEEAEIILFERGEFISFANCGLPYHIGDSIKERAKLLVQTPEAMRRRFNIDVRVHSNVTSIHTQNQTVKVVNQEQGVYEETYDYLILSPGAKAIRPNLPGIKHPNIYTLRNIPDTDQIKTFIDTPNAKTAVVIGGGFVGIEMAENLAEKGVAVTLVEAAPHILAPFDSDMVTRAEKELQDHGVGLILGDSVTSFQDNNRLQDRRDRVTVSLKSGKSLTADLVILAIGVTPDTDFIQGSGINLGPKGHILVNEHLQTSVNNVYAAGDAVEIIDFVNGQKTAVPLAGPANKQGRIVADNICGLASTYKGTQGTSIIKIFGLTGAATGNNERTLTRLGLPFHVIYVHPNSHASYYPGAIPLTIKLIFNMEGRILGAQIFGYTGVDKRIDDIATVIRLHGTVADLTELELAYAPPYSSAKDPVNMAGYVAENVLLGHMAVVRPSDMAHLDPQSVQLVDVRTEEEFLNGYIPGAINIPLDSIRHRLNEFSQDQEIWIYCKVGLRGYLAARILSQKGYQVKNLTGGYESYILANFKPNDVTPTDNTPINDMPINYTASTITPENAPATTNAPMDVSNTQPGRYDKELDACGLCCPGPLIQVKNCIDSMQNGEIMKVTASDPGFYEDIKSWCYRTNNKLIELAKQGGLISALIQKTALAVSDCAPTLTPNKDNKTLVVFSGDLDKALASFIIANGAASMGKKVTMFFTFWGLNILRKPEPVTVEKGLIDKLFGLMMPRGSKKLKLSNMNMLGLGTKMMRTVMKNKNISTLEELIQAAIDSGIEIVACQMSMDVMGLKPEELLDGVKIGGVGYYLGEAEDSNVNLFI